MEKISKVHMDVEKFKINNKNIIKISREINININLISIFRINNYLYLYIKLNDKIIYNAINADTEKDFKSLNENS